MHTHDLTYSGFFTHLVWRIALIFVTLTASGFTAKALHPSKPAVYDQAGFSSLPQQQSRVCTSQNDSRFILQSSRSEDAKRPHFPFQFLPESDKPNKQKMASVELERTSRHSFTQRERTLNPGPAVLVDLKRIDLALFFWETVVMLD